MTDNEILSHIDHTLLRPTSTVSEIDALCDEAISLKTASVCVPPCYVKYINDKYPELNICTVIGFPLGYNTTEVKCFEAREWRFGDRHGNQFVLGKERRLRQG